MGELHLEVLIDRLKREFSVECTQGAPQVNYKKQFQDLQNIERFTKANRW